MSDKSVPRNDPLRLKRQHRKTALEEPAKPSLLNQSATLTSNLGQHLTESDISEDLIAPKCNPVCSTLCNPPTLLAAITVSMHRHLEERDVFGVLHSPENINFHGLCEGQLRPLQLNETNQHWLKPRSNNRSLGSIWWKRKRKKLKQEKN